jgi:hypothetical protein
MFDWYGRMPPEEQRVVVVTLFAASAALWLAVAWEEAMVLAAIPLLTGLATLVIRSIRKRAAQQDEEILY